jgi:uncharacterized membrane protein YGL010W
VTDIDDWLIRYEQSHRSLGNPIVYWVAVPMVIVGLTGLFWLMPVPVQFQDISPLLNWGSAFLMVTAVYYFIISLSLAIGLLPFLLGLAAIQMWLANSSYPAIGVSSGLLVAGAVGLLLGRRGSILQAVQDLQLVMLGPAWLLSALYKRFGIPF